MAKRSRKSSAAVTLGKKRWKGTSAEQRSEQMRELVKKRWAKKKRSS
jgi:hypothetical protein